MVAIFASHWLAGAWYAAPSVGVLKDVNGVALAVGDRVNVACTVTALTPTGSLFGNARLMTRYGPGTILDVSTLNVAKE